MLSASASQHPCGPIFGLASTIDKLVGPDTDVATSNPSLEPGPHGFVDGLGQLQDEPFCKCGLDDRSGDDMV